MAKHLLAKSINGFLIFQAECKMISTNSLPEISRASAAAEIKINVFYVPVLVKENVLRPFISVAEVILF